MGTIFHINVNALDASFIEDLKKQFGAAELEIHIATAPENWLTDEVFWTLIEKLDWTKEGDDEAVLAPLIEALADMPIANIHQFQNILTEKLWSLDTLQHAQASLRGNESDYLSVDGFLYDRCCVVANGKDFYENVLLNPANFPVGLSFGALLSAASKAHLQKTGKPLVHIPLKSHETYSNKSGWEN